jgi:hypothetical protein
MKLQILLCAVLMCTGSGTFSQEKFTLTGYVKDSLSSETLIGCTISINGKERVVNSNQYGFFSITLAKGHYKLTASYVGYVTSEAEVDLNGDINFNFLLNPRSSYNEAVTVYANKRDANVMSAQVSKIDLNMSEIKSLPVLFGEIDILKTLQLLPGVSNAGEGNTGLYVRGGGPDQNLILLDDAIVYNTGHLFGFFSIFNGDAVKNTSLIKGGMPAQYGGRLSSVLDITMKEGNMNKFQVEGGIGTISSRVSIQGPIKKQKASFIVSARRTYIDVLVKPFVPKSSQFYGSGYYFYDLNTKVNLQFSDKDRLYLSGYFGRDVFDFRNSQRSFSTNVPWGNATATLRWNHVFNRKLFANTTLLYNDYRFAFNASQDDFNLSLASGIHDLSAKTDFDFFASPRQKIKFGALYTYHVFTPNILSGNQDSTQFTPNNENKKYANEMAAYVQDDIDVSNRFKLSLGLRWSGFEQIGPYTIYDRDANGNKLDSTVYKRGQPIVFYNGLEPRFSIRYELNDLTSLKAAVTRNLQYIHLVSNAGTTLPTDLWVPSTYRVSPQIAWQYTGGIYKNFHDNMYETSFEVYYKTMENQIEYKEGYTPSLKDPEESFVFGKGWSYGGELYINKAKGRLTGWIGYTLSWTWRQFPALNNDQPYPAKYDRRHDLSIVAMYELNSHWKFSGVFVYASGNATSLPVQFYITEGVLTQEYSKINQYRLPAYHRLDLSATYIPNHKPNKKIQTSWVFGIYNAYSHLNPYFIYYSQSGSPYNGTLKVQAKQVSLFPIIPSITWNFKF